MTLKDEREALKFLEEIAFDIETDATLIDATSPEELEAELHEAGIDAAPLARWATQLMGGPVPRKHEARNGGGAQAEGALSRLVGRLRKLSEYPSLELAFGA